MKIAQVSATFPPYMAGTGNVCYNYSVELAKLGHDVTVFTSNSPKNAEFNYPKNVNITKFDPIFQIGNAPCMPKLLTIKNFDLIHLHYPFFFGGEFIYLLKKLKNEKYVLSYHNNVTLPGFRGKMVDLYAKTVSKKIMENAERIIVPTLDFFDSSVKDFLGMGGDKVIEIPNGVDISAYKGLGNDVRTRYNLENFRVILFVGALDKAHYYKGLGYLMKSFKDLVKDYKNLKLMVVGNGNLKDYYMNLSKKYSINESVIFIGKISIFEELAKYYEASDIIVYPTVNAESFGMVLIEAMAAGKPVIANNVPGVRVVLDDEINGFLTEPKNIDDLNSKIKLLLEDEDLRNKMGYNGKKKAEKEYSWQVVVKKLEKAYKTFEKF